LTFEAHLSNRFCFHDVIGLYKAKVIRRRSPWRHLEPVEYATLEWVDWFNHRQLLEPIGNMPPAEFEASYYHSTGQLPMSARLKPEGFRKSRAVHIDHCGLLGQSHALVMS
jgi:hypothetical protein